MIVCPLCEHAQAIGEECEVCGKKLSATSEAPFVARFEGLELTRLEEAVVADVETVPGLEPTRHAPVTAVPEPIPYLEPTRLEDVTVAVEPIPELERTQAEPLPWEERAPAVLAPLCRYCRTPASPGDVLCGRCGMRLPVSQPTAAAPPPEGPAARCPSCGSLSLADICPGCGGKVRFF
jgi:rRNA maturation protein Nop10